jgi:hypothetical protein
MEPEGFSSMLTRALNSFPSWARCIQSIPPNPISLRSILIFSHFCLGLPSHLFTSVFPCKILCAFLFALSYEVTTCLFHPPSLVHYIYIWQRVQVIQFSTAFHHFFALGSKYYPQHRVLKHPQSTNFLP